MPRAAALPELCLAVALACLAGCTDIVTVWVDPPVYVGARSGAVVIEGDPSLRIGYLRNDDFTDLTDERIFHILWGLQGGYWSMPEVRVTGLGDPQPSGGATMFMTCRLTADTGEVLSDLDVKARLYGGDGYLYAPNYPIPVTRQPPQSPDDVSELDGVGARFECAVRDNDDRSASVTTNVQMMVTQ